MYSKSALFAVAAFSAVSNAVAVPQGADDFLPTNFEDLIPTNLNQMLPTLSQILAKNSAALNSLHTAIGDFNVNFDDDEDLLGTDFFASAHHIFDSLNDFLTGHNSLPAATRSSKASSNGDDGADAEETGAAGSKSKANSPVATAHNGDDLEGKTTSGAGSIKPIAGVLIAGLAVGASLF
ncbi:hypothetical protein GGI07_001138 [Coemansia sp. Benny D115]|nr:hypothetical protein GGI07_001138 [Coemansia sp. Benny D115]